MATSSSITRLTPPVAPRLLGAPSQYSSAYQEQYSNALRLYFNQLDRTIGTFLGPQGGRFLNNPLAAVQRTTDVIFAANTVKEITFDENDYLNGCRNDGTNGITVDQAGIYNYQFSIQFANTDSQIHATWVWLRVNNVDVPGTASKWDISAKHGSSDGYAIGAANFFVELAPNDYVSLYAAVDQAYIPATSQGIYMEAYPVQTTPFPHPSIPSVVATLTFVSSAPT